MTPEPLSAADYAADRLTRMARLSSHVAARARRIESHSKVLHALSTWLVFPRKWRDAMAAGGLALESIASEEEAKWRRWS